MLHTDWIPYSLCSTIGMTLVYLVALYFPSRTGFCTLGIIGLYELSRFSGAFNTLSYADVSLLESFLWYMSYDGLGFSFSLTLYPSSVITYTGSLSSGYDVGILSYYITGTKYSLFVSRNIFKVSTGSVNFHSSHLILLVVVNLLVSGL